MPDAAYAYNRTRQAFLASRLEIAATHWARLRGLLLTSPAHFNEGNGLWISPSRGVHTIGMRYSIDVVYLNRDRKVIHVEENVKPWRMTRILGDAESVLELPAHTVWQTCTKPGDEIEIAFERSGS